ncbi:hypothetical protein ACFLSV_06230 [Bacteroidota bacterium]
MKILISILFIFLFTNISKSQERIEDEFESSGKVWGYVFGDYFYKAGGDSIAVGRGFYSSYAKDYNAFEFRRAIIGYDYKICKHFETRFSLSYEGGDFTSSSNRTVFIKDALLTWKEIFKNSDLSVGLMKTPTFGYTSEEFWGYRSIEKTLLDFQGIASSRDIGISLRGFFDDNKDYGYNFMVGNGKGTKLETNKYKRFYGHLFSYLLDESILLEAYSDYEKVSPERSNTTIKGFLGYQSDKVTAGVEVFQQMQKNAIGDTAIKKPFGVSVFVRGNIIKDKLNAFGRFDYFDPDTDNSNYGFKENFISVGLDIIPHKNVHIMPNVWVNTYTDKSASNIDIKTDIVPRVTFWYIYK